MIFTTISGLSFLAAIHAASVNTAQSAATIPVQIEAATHAAWRSAANVSGYDDDIDSFAIKAATAAHASLPHTTTASIGSWASAGAARPLVLRNVPIDWSPSHRLPTDGSNRAAKRTRVSEAVLFGVASMVGDGVATYGALEPTYSTPAVHDGFAVVPSANRSITSAVSNPAPQDMHQDMSYLPDAHVPDLLALLCLSKGAVPTPTRLVDNREVAARLPSWADPVLRDGANFFVTRSPWVSATAWSKGVSNNTDGVFKPLLSGPRSWPSIAARVYLTSVVPQSASAARAYAAFNAAVNAAEREAGMSLQLNDGELLLFNNKRWLHARSPSNGKAGQGGSGRFLQRSYFLLPDRAAAVAGAAAMRVVRADGVHRGVPMK